MVILLFLQKAVSERPSAPSAPAKPPTPVSAPPNLPPPDTGPYSNAESERLKGLVIQRDNEISILFPEQSCHQHNKNTNSNQIAIIAYKPQHVNKQSLCHVDAKVWIR